MGWCLKILFAVCFILDSTSFIAYAEVAIGSDIRDFSFIVDGISKDDIYEISGLRTFPKATRSHIQSYKKSLLVSHQASESGPINSGFVQDLWLIAGKKHIIEIHASSTADAFLYVGYGHKIPGPRGNKFVSFGGFLWFQQRTLNDYLAREYDTLFRYFGMPLSEGELLSDGKTRVIDVELVMPKSHEKENSLVPIHLGLAFYNDARPGKDMISVSSWKVLYYDDVKHIESLLARQPNETKWNVLVGKRNSPPRSESRAFAGQAAANFVLRGLARQTASTIIGIPLSFVGLLLRPTEMGDESCLPLPVQPSGVSLAPQVPYRNPPLPVRYFNDDNGFGGFRYSPNPGGYRRY